jgi:DNA repair exonuclease SbcCD nuclease subunit
MMKFLHCADVHLDSPMRGLARYDGAPVEQLRGATRHAFERLVRVALEEAVAFVVIAGDLYDGDRDDFQTAMFLQRQLRALRDADVPVVIAYGNHDAANEITKRLTLPEGVHVFPHDAAGTVELEDAGVVVHGRSYANRAVFDDLSVGYPRPVQGLLNVGVLHTSIDGRPGHDPYAPCTLDGLVSHGYNYWALGHVHKREHHARDDVHVVFPGNLQGRDVGETGPKGATLVDYEDDKVQSVVHRDLASVRWARLELDLVDTSTVDEALERVITALGVLQGSSEAELHAVRVVLKASPAVSHEWLRQSERFDAQLRADATANGETLWLERIELQPVTSPTTEVSGEALEAVREALASLRTGGDTPARSSMVSLLAGLRSRFGSELKDVVQLGAGVLDEASFPELLDEVEALLVAELEKGS